MLPVGKYFLGKGPVVGQIPAQPLVGLVVGLPEPENGHLVGVDLSLNGLSVFGDQREVSRALAAAEERVDVADLVEILLLIRSKIIKSFKEASEKMQIYFLQKLGVTRIQSLLNLAPFKLTSVHSMEKGLNRPFKAAV